MTEVSYEQQGDFDVTVDSQGEIIAIDENSQSPILVPIWRNHDIFLRWTGLPTGERYHGFASQAVLEVAVDTMAQGTETAFFAVAADQAETEYVLHPNHHYLVTLQIGADNVRPVTKHYRLTLGQSHLAAGVVNRKRLELEEIERVPPPI